MIINEADEWRLDGDKITPAMIERLVRIADEESALIIEHWHYRGSSADRFVTTSGDDLREYFAKQVYPGDAIHVWRFDECCRDDNTVEHGKVPDERGRVPRRGAY